LLAGGGREAAAGFLFGGGQEQSCGGGVLPAVRARYREAVMELLRILETPVAIRVVMALSLAMMLAVILGLA